MHGSFGQLVVLRNQTDLDEQVVDGVIGHVDPGEPGDTPRFLAKVADRRTAPIARHQMRLELARRHLIELGVDIAAQREEAAPHRAISR